MNFLYPYVLYGTAIPILLGVLYFFIYRQRSKRWETLVSPNHRDELLHTTSSFRKLAPMVFGLIGFILLILALARPYDKMMPQEEKRTGHNLLIALDCSRSMLTKDITPSRLERSKTIIYDLLDEFPEENFGLIIFSGESHPILPFTYDHDAVKSTLEQVEYGWLYKGGTNLTMVLTQALSIIGRDQEKNHDKKDVLVIFSDGEETSPLDPKIVNAVKEHNIIVVTVGVGTKSGAKIPDDLNPNNVYLDQYGKPVVSKLQPEALMNIASETQGVYLSLSDTAQLHSFVRNLAEKLAEKEISSSNESVPHDIFERFAIPALLCLVLSLILGTQWRQLRWRKSTAIILTLLSLSAITQAKELAPLAMEKLKAGKPSDAVKLLEAQYGKLADKHFTGDDLKKLDFAIAYAKALENTGTAKEVFEGFSKALTSSDTTMQAETYYNMGNLLAKRAFDTLAPKETKQGASPLPITTTTAEEQSPSSSPTAPDKKLIEKTIAQCENAIESYNQTLVLEPKHQGATTNKKRLQDYIDELKNYLKQQEQQQQNQDDKKDQQDQKQDKNQQDQQNKQDQKKNDSQNNKEQKDNENQSSQDQNDKKGDQNKKDQKDNKEEPDKQNKGDQKDKQNPQDKGNEDKQKNQGDNNEQKNNNPDKKGDGGQDNKQDQNKSGDQQKDDKGDGDDKQDKDTPQDKDHKGDQKDQNEQQGGKDQQDKTNDPEQQNKSGDGEKDKTKPEDQGAQEPSSPEDKEGQDGKSPNQQQPGSDAQQDQPEDHGTHPSPEQQQGGQEHSPENPANGQATQSNGSDLPAVAIDPEMQEKLDAAQLLKNNADMERGSVIPYRTNHTRPDKDY